MVFIWRRKMFDPKQLFSVKDLVGIVTGGAGLLGRHFSLTLASLGAKVTVADKNIAALEQFKNSIDNSMLNQFIFVECDVANEDSVMQMLSQTKEHLGPLNFLVNNAAVPPEDPKETFRALEDYNLSEWQRMMEVNIDGMFLVAKHVGKTLIEQGNGGSIIQTSSIYGLMSSDKRIYEGSLYKDYPINNPAPYSASKAAVIGLTKWLATNWAEYNIRVNTIAPGGVEADVNEEFKKRYSDRVPMGRMAESHEITGTVVYLISNASSYITGQCIAIDGGLSAW